MDPQIAAAFANGTIQGPSTTQPDLVHLTRALASASGAPGFDDDPLVEQLLGVIGPLEHVVFVLLDGLGMNLLARLPSSSFLRRRLRKTIRATCPSTTACALTSIATGAWPAEHGVTGWFTHLPEHGLTMATLPMVERFSVKPLSECGLSAQEVFPIQAYHPQLTLRPLTLLPRPIVDTVFARYSRGDTPASAYDSMTDAVDQVLNWVNGARAGTHTHVYVSEVDSACHHDGVGAEGVLELVLELEAQLVRLREMLTPRARLVISADHGLLDVPLEAHMPLLSTDSLLDLLEAPPSGDARLPVFHVRPGAAEAFVAGFTARFGHAMRLLSIDEADELRLFGPRPLSSVARGRFGDFVGIAIQPATLHYVVPSAGDGPPHKAYLAQHAGLTPDEMEIPLIVA